MGSTRRSDTHPPGITFVPPKLPALNLPRPRLERRLGPTVAERMTLVTGPAGSGKTTLVRSWLTSSPWPWAWLTVDPAHSRSGPFWVAMVKAVQHAAGDIPLNVIDVVGSEDVGGQALAELLVADILHWPADAVPVIVVIDDAHLLDAQCWREVEWLLTHLPPHLHLLVASRSDPPFAIARYRTLGWISDVRAQDLVLTGGETEALLRDCGGDDWAAIAGDLHARTEGWVAGVRLAILAMQRGTEPARVLTSDGAAHGMVSELLFAEAFEQQPADVRSFLESTSVAVVLEPGLCAALTGRADSREVLRRLAADHVFVAPFEDRSDRFRYHPLFAELLRLELRRLDRRAQARLHGVAAEWFEAEGRYAEAIEHAAQGGHHELVLRLIADHLGDLYAEGLRAEVGSWLLDLPDHFVVGDPDRAVEHCEALLFVLRREWLQWLPQARAVVGDDRPDLQARIATMDALSWAGQGRTDEFERLCAQAEALRPVGTADPLGDLVLAWRARLCTLAGDHHHAVRLAETLRACERRLIMDLPASSLLAATLHAAGDATAALLVAGVIETWRRLGEPDVMGMADALPIGTMLALERGDLEEAENLAASAIAVTSEPPSHLLRARAEIARASVDAALGRPEAARARLSAMRAEMTAQGASPALLALLDPSGPVTTPPSRPDTGAGLLGDGMVETLTDRELTILKHLGSHLTFPEIGRELYISRHTVKTHVARIYRKLGVAGRSAAITAARRHGML